MNSFRAVIAAWLNAYKISRVGVRMNRSARGEVLSAFSGSTDWILRYIKSGLF